MEGVTVDIAVGTERYVSATKYSVSLVHKNI